MHIADGIITPEICIAADVLSLAIIYYQGKKVDAADVPKMGLMSATLFVASLIHFPIAGTSIHLGLFGLAGIILGLRAFPVIFAALLFQSLIFQHGGLLSLGLNAINMGSGALVGWLIWRTTWGPEALRAFLAGFLGIIIPAFFMAIEFELSGYGKGIFYILAIYFAAAAIEAGLTVTIIHFFRRIDSNIIGKK